MITVRIKGGLGNQLFQYAAGYALSKRLMQPLNFDIAFTSNQTARDYKLAELCVDSCKTESGAALPFKTRFVKNMYLNKFLRICGIEKIRCSRDGIYLLESKQEVMEDFFTVNTDNLYMDGYYQSPVYFNEYRADLLRQFLPKYEPETDYMEKLNEIKSCTAVAVHVRRGDFSKFRNDSSKFHYLLEKDYYIRALDYIKKNVESPVFFWFSDDMEWVKQNFEGRGEFRFIRLRTKRSDIDELMLMKHCSHIITANSTFSWWGAWLNENENAIHIVPKKPYGNNQMIPEDWIKI